jgi:hypothetical protein
MLSPGGRARAEGGCTAGVHTRDLFLFSAPKTRVRAPALQAKIPVATAPVLCRGFERVRFCKGPRHKPAAVATRMIVAFCGRKNSPP